MPEGRPQKQGDAGLPVSACQAEEKAWMTRSLHDSELRYRRLFEAARDGILILEVETGRICDVNPFLVELLNFSREEILGKTVGELSPFKDIETNKVMLERLQQHGYVRYEDLPLETSHGRRIAVEFVCNVYQEGPQQVIQCNIRDITARKHAQDEILHFNKELEQRVLDRTALLQAANNEMEAFSYTVSHDLRAPLRHIIGFVQLLEEDAGLILSKESGHYLKRIFRSAKKMGDLIEDLLTFARVGKSEMRKTVVDLDDLVGDVITDFGPELKDRKIAWGIHATPQVFADRALLRMVLVNLISNAIKFTGGRTEGQIDIGVASDGDMEAVIYIKDNGVGFDPKCSGKLFGVFQRLPNREEFEGTGIGLASVKRVIHRHGGRTWAEGVVGQGATFYFSLPKQEVAQGKT